MAICKYCRAETGTGRYCASCGNAVDPPAAAVTAGSADLPETTACLLCYSMWALTGVVFLVLEPYNRSKLVRFHAWQSIATSVFLFIAWFVVLLGAWILRILPLIGVPLALILLNAFGLAVLGLWLLLMYKAYQGGSLDLPFISRFAQKQA
jgi:uncharacterized membrane protein